MSHDWILLEKVGKWIGLEGQELNEYLEIASNVHAKAIEEKGAQYDLDSEYFDFLNNEVLNSTQFLNSIPREKVEKEKLDALRSGTVNFDDIVDKRHLVDYDLDEIVDFVMLLKLIRGFQNRTHQEEELSLDRLHYFVFIINNRISKSDDLVRLDDTIGLGNLQRTGYRYSFLKQEGIPISKSLQRDKNRLQAWGLIDEEVIEDSGDHRLPFKIFMGESGEFLFTRYKRQMKGFNSLLLKTWENEQQRVLKEFASESKETITSYLESVDRLQKTKNRNVVLHGRPMNFAEENEDTEENKIHV